jgi:hypothetical protein
MKVMDEFSLHSPFWAMYLLNEHCFNNVVNIFELPNGWGPQCATVWNLPDLDHFIYSYKLVTSQSFAFVCHKVFWLKEASDWTLTIVIIIVYNCCEQ